MYIGFTKSEGAGNDFILIDNMNGRITLSKEEIAHLCDRRFGIGGDGLVLIESSQDADCFMNYYDSSGIQSDIYGSGPLCTALYLNSFLKAHKDKFQIDTKSGIKDVTREEDGTYSAKDENSLLLKIQARNVFSGMIELG